VCWREVAEMVAATECARMMWSVTNASRKASLELH
jgi:hypothetical protein